MAIGFGTGAQAWAQRAPAGLSIVAADLERAPAALAQVAALKRDGEAVAASLFMIDTRTEIALNYAASIVGQVTDYDERLKFFGALAVEALVINDVPQRDWMKIAPAPAASAREFVAACDVHAVRSNVEAQRFFSVCGFLHDTIVTVAPVDPMVPEPRVRHGPADSAGQAHFAPNAVVVWAADTPRARCAMFAFALEPLRIPVIIVCSDGGAPLPGLKAEFVTPDAAPAVLERALAVVCGAAYDPGTALALARHGVPLATALTSGAHEFLRPAYVFAPWDARSIFDATMSALGGRPAVQHRSEDFGPVGSELRKALDELPADGPPVSVVIPTYNRREQLRAALESISRQTYRTFEIVVVNDCGADVADVVAEFPLARLITNERNLGVTPSVNAGIEAAAGEYIALLADDDLYQPDHLARLVAALGYSGQMVAHSMEMVCHFDVAPGKELVLRGHHLGAPRPTFPSEMLVTNRITGPAMMIRREALRKVGLFDPEIAHGADFEMWMRLSKLYDFVFVARVTSQISMRNDNSQISHTSGAETSRLAAKIYGRHPVRERIAIEAQRSAQLSFMAQQAVLRSAPPAFLSATDLAELSYV